jgi:acyl carrier protein|tara:strand:+ start:1707 stop:1925 length:219 start_codon:yes stop_codon:yes gene_type:complete
VIYKDLIAKSFNEPKKSIKENLLLTKFNWDSMTKINLITFIDNRYKKTLDYRKFEKLKTFGDLNKLITKTLK